jgi:hypothetical protein
VLLEKRLLAAENNGSDASMRTRWCRTALYTLESIIVVHKLE